MMRQLTYAALLISHDMTSGLSNCRIACTAHPLVPRVNMCPTGVRLFSLQS